MDFRLSSFFRLMSTSWIFFGLTGCDQANEPYEDPAEELDRMVIQESQYSISED